MLCAVTAHACSKWQSSAGIDRLGWWVENPLRQKMPYLSPICLILIHIFTLKKDRLPWPNCQQDKPVSHVGIREPSLSHDCASKETLASKNACSNRRSCWQYMAVICWDRLVGELGLKALTSKMPVQTTFPRNLLHTYPAWLPLHLWLFFCERLQRWFTVTSVHTSFSRPAVMSRCSLWWMNGYPPVGHDSVWPMVNACPQVQCEASYGVGQP